MSAAGRIAARALLLALVGCAGVPSGRYGVRSVRLEGVRQVDPESIRACLGTRARQRFGIDIGLRGTPECGDPPFDGGHAIVDPWSWPWTEWPLFDESVFERDVERIERWYRARGFYDARVVDRAVEPASALAADHVSEGCGDGRGNCEAIATFVIEEGEPVHIARMSLEGIDELPAGMRQRLRSVLLFRHGDRFDEALYERTKREMQRVLAESGYARARVRGDVKVNRTRREVFLDFLIDAGPPSVLGRICVVGYESLPPEPMLGVAALEPGEAFSLAELEEAQRTLYALGVFAGVEVSPIHPDERARPGGPEDATPDVATADGRAEVAATGTAGQEARTCTPPPARVPEGREAVDIEIRVSIGRVRRVGVGVGLQAGQAITFGTVTTVGAQNAAQWDLHASLVLEERNLFDRLVRARLEIRPRVVFAMPLFNFAQPLDPPLGLQVNASWRWPSFLEPRTNLLVTTRYDLGPMPFTNFFRSELDAAIGPERSFFAGRLYAGVFVHGNWFLPADRQPIEARDRLPEMGALWLEEVVRLDLRDNPSQPTEGAFFSVSSHQSVQPLSSWDLVRFTAEARGYIPLPLGMVLAGRFQIGIMQVFGSQIASDNVYELSRLGPPALQLTGGGASSNRGYLPGLAGDAEQVYVSLPRSDAALADGAPITSRPVRITAGNYLWDASIELRIPITTAFGVVLFTDAGDIDRFRLQGADTQPIFRFDHPQFTFGFGIRYRTDIGPFRLDVGIRPDELQFLSQTSQLPPTCTTTSADRCRPASFVSFFDLFRFPGAFHLTIGEAF